MKPYLILIIFFSSLTSFGQSLPGSISNKFQPDTSINQTLFLENAASIEKNLGDIMPVITENDALPDITFLNASGNEYLRMFFHPGNTKNSFSAFEVGYVMDSSFRPKDGMKKLNFISFETERRLKLGITQKDLLNKQGTMCTIEKKSGITIIRYVLNESSKSSFLRRYNMPVYFSEYYLKDYKVIKYSFGFEYP